MNNGKKPTALPVNVTEALEAIAGTGKGRCWYCDHKLPHAPKAIDDGWDVQRIDEQPVATIILVCPSCQECPAETEAPHARAAEPEENAFAMRFQT